MNIVPVACDFCQYGQKKGHICYMPNCKNGSLFKQRGVEKLEEALEEVEKMGTYRNDGSISEDALEEPWAVIAGNAIAEWRRQP